MTWKENLSRLSVIFFKKSDPMIIYSLTYWIYVFTGFWRIKSSKPWKKNLYRVYQAIVILFYAVAIILFAVDAVIVRNDFEKLSFNLSTSFLIFIAMMKVTLLARKKDSLETLYNKLDNHLNLKQIGESEEDLVLLRERASVLMKLSKLFYSLLVFGLPLRVTADTALDSRNYIIPIHFKEKLEHHYEIVYAQQVCVIFHFLVVVISHDMLIYAILLRFIAHFDVLEKNIQKINNIYPKKDFSRYVIGYRDGYFGTTSGKDVLISKENYSEKVPKHSEKFACVENAEMRERRTEQLLKEIISHHQTLLREIDNFSRLYGLPLFVQACGAGFLIGIIILQLIMVSTAITIMLLQQILFVFTTLVNILHLCSFASDLTFKSRDAANALYETPWQEMNMTNKSMVLFAMKKLIKDPPILKGGGVIVIDRVTYLRFLQISYNMVAVLRNIYKQELQH